MRTSTALDELVAEGLNAFDRGFEQFPGILVPADAEKIDERHDILAVGALLYGLLRRLTQLSKQLATEK